MKKVLIIALTVCIMFSSCAICEDIRNQAGIYKAAMDNIYANFSLLDYAGYISITSATDDIKEHEGIVIDRANQLIHLSSEVNSISLYVSQSEKMDAYIGWMLSFIKQFEKKDLENMQIYEKQAKNELNDISDQINLFITAFESDSDLNFNYYVSNPVTHKSWMHPYEGAVDMLILYQFLLPSIESCGFYDEISFPNGVILLKRQDGSHLLLIVQDKDAFIISFNGENTDSNALLGIAALCAVVAGEDFSNVAAFKMVENSDGIVAVPASEDILEKLYEAALTKVSFQNGYFHLAD